MHGEKDEVMKEEEEETAVPLLKITKDDYLKWSARFVDVVYLPRRGQIMFRPITKSNCEKLASENK